MDLVSKSICFIHSTNMNIHNTEILERIVNYLKDRNIFDFLEFLVINNIGNEIDESFFKKISDKIIVINYSKDVSLFECVTIKQIISFSKIYNDYNVLYLHTKGVSYSKTYIYNDGIVSWTNYMLYSLVDNLQRCVELLKCYDTVGCNFRNDNGNIKKHYSGNFWWARTDYLKKLKCTDFNTKYDAEFCILSQNPNYFNIYTLEHMYETNYPLEVYKYNVISSLHAEQIFFCKLGWSGAGLCKQIYSLISCIFKAINLKQCEKFIIIDDFLTDIQTNIYVSADTILNLNIMNLYLKKYNIYLMSKNNIKLNIKSILYGTYSNEIDITNKVIEKFSGNNYLFISKYTNLNLIDGDPSPNILKQIKIIYSLNDSDYTVYKHFDEDSEININFKDFNNVIWHAQNNINTERIKNYNLIHNLLLHIKFLDRYHIISQQFINTIISNNDTVINVIHIRNEADAIQFWGNINNMTNDEYKNILENKYIHLINTYIDKNSLNIILSMNTSNKVIDYLKINNYKYFLSDKTRVIGREENAIIDLINGTNCNNIYIGNANMTTYNGSTFSYVLYTLLEQKPGIKKILIDLDNINVAEVVI